MPHDDDLIYKKGLSEERIQEIQKAANAYRYTQNCVTAAVVGIMIAIFTALLLRISFGILYILVGSLGAGVGYAFYVWGKYLEEKMFSRKQENESSPEEKEEGQD
jgi:hypothetical protein